MVNKRNFMLVKAWKQLLTAYVSATLASLLAGFMLIHIFDLEPARIQNLSSKRISYAFPIIEFGAKLGFDLGLILFVWNSLAALATISFIYTAQLFNPQKTASFPQTIRRAFCGRTRMKLLCLLPGCLRIEEEALRRLYVWLMIPLLGIILLGLETGLSISTSTYSLGSTWVGIVSFLPHGIIEIPCIALAGAVAYSAHLLVKERVQSHSIGEIFDLTETYRRQIPIKTIACSVIGCLLVAGLVEAHVTRALLIQMLNQ